MKSMKALLALLMAFALFATACGSDDADETVDAGSDTTEDTTEEDTTDDSAAAQPGDGVEVTMARADWTTGYFQAEVYKLMMEELGFTVSEPSELELAPSLAYLAMSQGDIDFWVNSWYPGHNSWLEADLPDGSKVGDSVSKVGEQMLAGGLQGFLITKSVAEENGITTLDQLYSDPELSALFDDDGDGAPELYGCPESWTCDNIITEMACQFDWPIQQVQAGYDTMIAEAQDKADNGEPMVIYTWTPSAYIATLIPGDNVMWISAEGKVDRSNCSGQDGGEEYEQPDATAEIGADSCLLNSADECRLAWTAADILVSGNNDFLAANPAAEELFLQVVMPLIDVALANVEQGGTDGSATEIRAIAERWIAGNRGLVDGWMDAARAAGLSTPGLCFGSI
jgi:glycine betaine/proline transport system substrate-binding protein